MSDKKPEFDRDEAEEALQEILSKKLGGAVEIYESTTPCVVAFARLDAYDIRKVDFQEVAAMLARKLGIGVVCIASADWTFDDKCDEEATYIAFEGAPEDYDSPWRNDIVPVTPEDAPSEQDFADARKARAIVVDAVAGIAARVSMLRRARKPDAGAIDAADREAAGLATLKDIAAGERETVSAILDLDLDRAVALHRDALAERAPDVTGPTPA